LIRKWDGYKRTYHLDDRAIVEGVHEGRKTGRAGVVQVHRDGLHGMGRCTARVPEHRDPAMSKIEDMVDDIMKDYDQELTGYSVGSCLYLRASGNPDAWIEGNAVHLGEWQ